MKTRMFILTILILTSQYINSQITPIQITNVGEYTTYSSNTFNSDSEMIKNQAVQTTLNIFESNTKARYTENSGFATNFFQQTLTTSNYNTLVTNRSKENRFSIIYNINQAGDTFSCALKIKNNLITLSNSEIEAILSTAMNHKFEYIKKPETISSFYFNITVDFVL